MANCLELLQDLNPSCEALNKVGGTNKRVWACQKDEIRSLSYDSEGYLTGFSMKEVGGGVFNRLVQYVGKRDKHDFGVTGVVGDTVNLYNQSGTLMLYAFSPEENKAIEKLYNADDVVLFIETNAGQIKAYGIDLGLNGTDLEMREGILLNDPTSCSVTLAGDQRDLPKVLKVGAGLVDVISYLDDKNGTAA
jgi:hypothetical protein